MKQLLAAQELLFPNLFNSLCTAMRPLMSRKLEQDNIIEDNIFEDNNDDV